jgi:hypothetical protein
MAVYKVIQDIEAEDKLLGPLTLRQFIYAGAAALFYYLTFLALTKGAAFMSVVFLPIALIGTFFAWPWSRDQPTEIWALAKIRFYVKPRKRIWNQSGVKELVTITAPRKLQTVYTNGLTQNEVQSRLRALAETIDSRGWAIKNVNVNMYQQPDVATVATSDRLIDMATIPQQVPELDIQASDDVMEASSPIARQFDTMIAASTKAHRQEIIDNLSNIGEGKPVQKGNDYWFLNQPGAATSVVPQDAVTFNTQVVSPNAQGPMAPAATPVVQQLQLPPEQIQEAPLDEAALIEKLHEQDRRENVNPYNRWHTIQPLSQQQAQQQVIQQQNAQNNLSGTQGYQPPQFQQPMMPPAPVAPAYQSQMPTPQASSVPAPQTPQQQVTAAPDPAILQLASNDDLNVATLAREANKRKELQDEVVISLH